MLDKRATGLTGIHPAIWIWTASGIGCFGVLYAMAAGRTHEEPPALLAVFCLLWGLLAVAKCTRLMQISRDAARARGDIPLAFSQEQVDRMRERGAFWWLLKRM